MVRKVTSNQGKKTPGINNIVFKTKKNKFQAIIYAKKLSGYKAKPV